MNNLITQEEINATHPSIKTSAHSGSMLLRNVAFWLFELTNYFDERE